MKLRIVGRNDAVDETGKRSQGFDAHDEHGQVYWLLPSLRNRLQAGRLNLKEGDDVIASEFVLGSDRSSLLVADFITRS